MNPTSYLIYRRVFWLMLSSFVLCLSLTPAQAANPDVRACMSELVKEASNDTTVGQLRERCRRQVAGAEDQPAEVSPVDVRLEQDRANVLQPFTLMAHRPNYILAGAHNAEGYDPTLYQLQYSDPTIELDDTEAQFQVSLKVPLWVRVADTFDIYAAYTNRSFWQLYNGDYSRPFRETNHEPEAWVQFTPGWEFLGFKNSANSIGIAHQSNGQGGVLSRSWNRVYANFVFQRGDFAFGIKPWVRIKEDRENDDNPDITDYMGHFEWRAGYKWNGHVFSFMSRNNLESGFDRGAAELGWSFPLHKYPYLKGYIQYFYGYGESLIDYDRKTNRVGIGIALTDWL